jgi:DDE family transposase
LRERVNRGRSGYTPLHETVEKPREDAFLERHKPRPDEQFKLANFTYDKAHERYICPTGKVLTLEARRHKIRDNIYRRYEANEADGGVCQLRERCVRNAATRRKHLAVYVEPAKETLSQQMIAKIDTPEARQI